MPCAIFISLTVPLEFSIVCVSQSWQYLAIEMPWNLAGYIFHNHFTYNDLVFCFSFMKTVCRKSWKPRVHFQKWDVLCCRVGNLVEFLLKIVFYFFYDINFLYLLNARNIWIEEKLTYSPAVWGMISKLLRLYIVRDVSGTCQQNGAWGLIFRSGQISDAANLNELYVQFELKGCIEIINQFVNRWIENPKWIVACTKFSVKDYHRYSVGKGSKA